MKKKNGENIGKEEQDLRENEAEDIEDECKEESTDGDRCGAEQCDAVKEDEAKKVEDDGLQSKMMRLQADFLNYKNRTEKEKTATYGNAVADVIKDLLPVIDNLERAVDAETEGENSFKDGVVMIYTQFKDILAKRGLKEIEALDKIFDPNIHYGVAFDSESEKEDGIVIEVFQKGYTVNDRVIRPSMVKIAKK